MSITLKIFLKIKTSRSFFVIWIFFHKSQKKFLFYVYFSSGKFYLKKETYADGSQLKNDYKSYEKVTNLDCSKCCQQKQMPSVISWRSYRNEFCRVKQKNKDCGCSAHQTNLFFFEILTLILDLPFFSKSGPIVYVWIKNSFGC